MFERYTERARRALFFGRFEVSQRGGPAIEPEHLMLGLLRDPGTIDLVLTLQGLSPPTLRGALEAKVACGGKVSTSINIPFSARAKRALELACEEADRLDHVEIGTGHLLLGLLREENGNHARVLTGHGLRLDEVRKALVRLGIETAAGSEPRRLALDHIAQVDLLLGRIVQAAADRADINELAAVAHEQLEALRECLGRDPSA